MKKLLVTIIGIFSASQIYAQDDKKNQFTLALTGYVDAYYAYFTNEMESNALQPYTTVSPRSERFGLNVAQIGLSYNADKVRGNVILHWGDIPRATWSEEFTNIQEANIGVRLAENWWIDAGFFTTHIGTESFLPKNNFLSSTAVATYNEPFYQAGAKLSYEGSDNWYGQLWVVNGYNFFLDANDAKSVGILFSYNLTNNTSITYTNLFGRESLDDSEVNQFRTYHNLYLNTNFNERWYLIFGGDFSTQSNSKLTSKETAILWNALATVRYQWNEEWSVTGRGEIFSDENGYISGLVPKLNNQPGGLELWGVTLGSEFKPMENAYVRGEVRYLNLNNETILYLGNLDPNKRWEVNLTIGYQFFKLFGL